MSLCLIKIVFSGLAPFLERIGLRKSSFEGIGSFMSIYSFITCLIQNEISVQFYEHGHL